MIPPRSLHAYVYTYFDAAGLPLYVGSTIHLNDRHGTHRIRSPWFGEAVRRQTIKVKPKLVNGQFTLARVAARAMEKEMIRALRPKFNKRGNPNWTPSHGRPTQEA